MLESPKRNSSIPIEKDVNISSHPQDQEIKTIPSQEVQTSSTEEIADDQEFDWKKQTTSNTTQVKTQLDNYDIDWKDN